MPDGKRRVPWLRQCCYHVSSRCYDGVEIFRFANARDQALKRLREMTAKHRVKVLNYLIEPNGYRLLLAAAQPARISEAMRFFNTATSGDYARKRGLEGRFWKGRYNITLVQRGPQALRCSFDMDFAMPHTGDEDLFHPLLWKHSGHLELTGVRKRYRIIDRKAMAVYFLDLPWERFRNWYIGAATNKWNSGPGPVETWWEEALIVGDRELCEAAAEAIPESGPKMCVYPASSV